VIEKPSKRPRKRPFTLARLRRTFFARYTPTVAKALLGCVLVRVVDGERLSGRIVETEAYRGSRDPASHAFRGLTGRNRVMFGEAGHSYVYFSYGNHWMLNLTTEKEGVPGAVLIRAIEPIEGIAIMKRRRGLSSVVDLASGPGKLTKAFAIDRGLNGEDLVRSRRLFVEAGKKSGTVAVSSRVGISEGVKLQWRFYLEGSPFVSRGRPSRPVVQNP
jgi:DNA-3-methyladenine glycosylase